MHRNFRGMVEFWLQRNLMFRDVLDRLDAETQARIDRQADPERFAPRLSRLGGFLLRELHMHHQVEDLHFFPQLSGLEPRLIRGFDMLEADHHAIDGLLHGFTKAANAALQAETETSGRNAAGRLLGQITGFRGLLDRHLTDEEELIVPVVLNTGFDA